MFNTFHYRTQSSCVLSRTLSVVTLIAQIEDVIYLSKGEKGKQKIQKELLDMQGQSYLSFVFSEWVVVCILRSDEVSPPANLRPPAPNQITPYLSCNQPISPARTFRDPVSHNFPKIWLSQFPPLCVQSHRIFLVIFWPTVGGKYSVMASSDKVWHYEQVCENIHRHWAFEIFLHRSRSKTRNMPKNVGLAGTATSMCLR